MLWAGAESSSPAAKNHDRICILGRKPQNERNRIRKENNWRCLLSRTEFELSSKNPRTVENRYLSPRSQSTASPNLEFSEDFGGDVNKCVSRKHIRWNLSTLRSGSFSETVTSTETESQMGKRLIKYKIDPFQSTKSSRIWFQTPRGTSYHLWSFCAVPKNLHNHLKRPLKYSSSSKYRSAATFSLCISTKTIHQNWMRYNQT